MGIFGSIRRGLGDGGLDRMALAQAFMAGDYGTAGQMLGQRARQRAAQQQAEAEAAEAARVRDSLTLGAKQSLQNGETLNPLLAGLIQSAPEAAARALSTRFETRNVSPDSEVVHQGMAAGQGPSSYRAPSAPTEIQRNVDWLRREGVDPQFVDRTIERHFNPDQWVTPPAGGYAEDVTRRVPLRPGSPPQLLPGSTSIPVPPQFPGQTPPIVPPTAPPSGGLTIMRNNNPGALRVPGRMEFQRFPTMEAGVRAQENQLGRYFQRGLNTIQSVVETYAPRRSRGGDNTDEQVNNYIAHVSRRLGVNPGQPIPPSAIPQLAEAMREFETGGRSRRSRSSGRSAPTPPPGFALD